MNSWLHQKIYIVLVFYMLSVCGKRHLEHRKIQKLNCKLDSKQEEEQPKSVAIKKSVGLYTDYGHRNHFTSETTESLSKRNPDRYLSLAELHKLYARQGKKRSEEESEERRAKPISIKTCMNEHFHNDKLLIKVTPTEKSIEQSTSEEQGRSKEQMPKLNNKITTSFPIEISTELHKLYANQGNKSSEEELEERAKPISIKTCMNKHFHNDKLLVNVTTTEKSIEQSTPEGQDRSKEQMPKLVSLQLSTVNLFANGESLSTIPEESTTKEGSEQFLSLADIRKFYAKERNNKKEQGNLNKEITTSFPIEISTYVQHSGDLFYKQTREAVEKQNSVHPQTSADVQKLNGEQGHTKQTENLKELQNLLPNKRMNKESSNESFKIKSYDSLGKFIRSENDITTSGTDQPSTEKYMITQSYDKELINQSDKMTIIKETTTTEKPILYMSLAELRKYYANRRNKVSTENSEHVTEQSTTQQSFHSEIFTESTRSSENKDRTTNHLLPLGEYQTANTETVNKITNEETENINTSAYPTTEKKESTGRTSLDHLTPGEYQLFNIDIMNKIENGKSSSEEITTSVSNEETEQLYVTKFLSEFSTTEESEEVVSHHLLPQGEYQLLNSETINKMTNSESPTEEFSTPTSIEEALTKQFYGTDTTTEKNEGTTSYFLPLGEYQTFNTGTGTESIYKTKNTEGSAEETITSVTTEENERTSTDFLHLGEHQILNINETNIKNEEGSTEEVTTSTLVSIEELTTKQFHDVKFFATSTTVEQSEVTNSHYHLPLGEYQKLSTEGVNNIKVQQQSTTEGSTEKSEYFTEPSSQIETEWTTAISISSMNETIGQYELEPLNHTSGKIKCNPSDVFCFCSVQSSFSDLLQLHINCSECIDDLVNYSCRKYIHIQPEIVLKKKEQLGALRRHRRSAIKIGQGPSVNDLATVRRHLLHNITKFKSTNEHIYAFPGSKVEMNCINTDNAEKLSMRMTDVKFHWTYTNPTATTSKYISYSPFDKSDLKVRANEKLVIQHASLLDVGSYLCSVKYKNLHNSKQKTVVFEHQLSVIQLPTYIINGSMQYHSLYQCQSLEVNEFKLLFPKHINQLLCESPSVCNVKILDPLCQKTKERTEMIVKFLVHMTGVTSNLTVFNDSTCNLICKQLILTKVITILGENLPRACGLPVVYRFEQQSVHFSPIENSLHFSFLMGCPEGYFIKDNICFPCTPGHFSPEDSAHCHLCSEGTYQPQPGAHQCLMCPHKFAARTCFHVFTNYYNLIGFSGVCLLLLCILLLIYVTQKRPLVKALEVIPTKQDKPVIEIYKFPEDNQFKRGESNSTNVWYMEHSLHDYFSRQSDHTIPPPLPTPDF